MIKNGKEIFQDNLTQLTTIIVSLALAFVGEKLAGDIVNMALIPFIKNGYEFIFSSEQLSILRNVLFPFIMYFLSCGFLLWMGVINLVTCKEMDDKSAIVLKVLLGMFQLILFGVLFVFKAKVFAYFMIFVFTPIILISILNFAASFHEVQKEAKID